MRDDKTGTDEELNTPDTARTIPTRRRKEPEPPATDEWRPPASLNPWARAFDGDSCRTNRTWEATKNRNNSPTCSRTRIRHRPTRRTTSHAPHWKACGEPNGRNSHNDRRKHQPAGRRTLPFRRLGRTALGTRTFHPQQIARHLLDPQWRNRDYNALDDSWK